MATQNLVETFAVLGTNGKRYKIRQYQDAPASPHFEVDGAQAIKCDGDQMQVYDVSQWIPVRRVEDLSPTAQNSCDAKDASHPPATPLP